MIMIYPQLVQYDYGRDGLRDRRRLGDVLGDLGGRQGLDVPAQPGHEVVGRHADDRRRCGLDDQHDRQVRGRPDRRRWRRRSPTSTGAEAPTTRRRSSIHYEAPVGNVLAQLEQFFVLPRHVWEPLEQREGGKGAEDVPARSRTCRWSPAARTRSSSTRRRERPSSSRTRTTRADRRTPRRSRSPTTRTPTR